MIKYVQIVSVAQYLYMLIYVRLRQTGKPPNPCDYYIKELFALQLSERIKQRISF
jgi:hypothetical protein